MKTFYIETWGCQMNDLDSQRLSGSLKLRGYKRVEEETEADLILLNTCSIRDKSEQKVYSHLGRLRELKLQRENLRIGVCGCVAQQEGERIRERAPWVDFVMGPGNVGHLDEVLDGARQVAVDFPDDRRYDVLAIDRPSATKAQVTIMEGCNKNCTFCIVPTTRGREVSRPFNGGRGGSRRDRAPRPDGQRLPLSGDGPRLRDVADSRGRAGRRRPPAIHDLASGRGE